MNNMNNHQGGYNGSGQQQASVPYGFVGQPQPPYPPQQHQPPYPPQHQHQPQYPPQQQHQPQYPPQQHQQQQQQQQPSVVLVQPMQVTPVTPAVIAVGPDPQLLVCPNCKATIRTTVRHEPNTNTHLLALCLCCCLCWPCACLPYCMDTCQNANHYCPNCNAFIGSHES